MVRGYKPEVLYEDKEHRVVWLGYDEAEGEIGVPTSQYLITDGDYGAVLDPGGYIAFERVVENLSEFIKPENVKYLLYTHQDPDVVGSLLMWTEHYPFAKIVVSQLWTRFVPHFGLEKIDVIGIPDEGMEIKLNNSKIIAIPAHFMHSPGNFHFYDEKSQILYSGDIGAATLPKGTWYLYVDNFEEHKIYMEGFHKRYIACKLAIDKYLEKVSKYKIKMIAPQHGPIITEKDVQKFFDWLRSLGNVGIETLK